MLLFFLLFYRSIVKLKDRYVSNLPTFFHFDENGSYYLISRNKKILINYIICTQKEYKLFQKDPDHDASNCYEHELKIDDYDKGKIQNKGAYQFIFSKNNDYSNRKFQTMNIENKSLINQKNKYKNINCNILKNYKNFIKKMKGFISSLSNKFFNNNIHFHKNYDLTMNINDSRNENTAELFNSLDDRSNILKEANEKNEIVVIFQNPKTYLDMNVYPCLFTKPLFTSIILLILILWLINWIINFTNSCTIHIFLTIAIIDSLLYFYFQSRELYFRSHSDFFTPFIPLRITFLVIFQVIFFSTILMLAKGWFIVHKSIGKMKIIYCFIYSILLALPQLMFQTNFINKALGIILIKGKKDELCLDQEISNELDFDYQNNLLDFFISKILSDSNTSECSDIRIWTAKSGWTFAFIGIGFIGVIFYYKDLITSIERSSEYVIAHLMVISESGIDPCTTPIMEKYVIYKYLSWGIIIYLGAQQFVMLITQFLENYVAFWIQQFIYDTVNLFGIIGAALILKLNKNRMSGFMQIPTSSDDTETEIEAESIDNNNIDHNQFNENLFYSIDNRDDHNSGESQPADMNLNELNNNSNNNNNNNNNNNSSNNNTYHHRAPARMTKRVVSRDEIRKFNISIENRSRLNSNLDENSNSNNSNFNSEINNQELNANATNGNQPRMVKWEEWMTLPPQPIVSQEDINHGTRRTRRELNNADSNENRENNINDINEDLIHQDNV